MKQIALLARALCCCMQGAYSQSIFNRIRNKVASTTSRKIENAIDKAADGGFARKEKKESTPQKEETAPAVAEKASAPEQQTAKEVKLASYSKFDFVPGGHTDNIGKAEDNLAFSKIRAEAVISIFTSEYEISADRLEADGKGADAPVGDNKTAEGRAMNRRLEFIKM